MRLGFLVAMADDMFRHGDAFLSYKKKNVGGAIVLDLQHTYVPPSMRGMGIAGQLCETAFNHAKTNGYRIIPTCSYISETFLPRNPQWKDLVYNSIGTEKTSS